MYYRKLFGIIMMVNLLLLGGLTRLVGLAEAAPVPTEEMTQVVRVADLDRTPHTQTDLTTRPAAVLPPAVPFERPLLQDSPVLTITKSTNPEVNAGEVLTYTIVVANGTITEATGTLITDVLDNNANFVWASGGGVHNAGVVTWNANTIAGEQTSTRTLLVTVASHITSGTVLTNTVEVTSTEGASDSDAVTTTVNREADLVLTKTDFQDPVLGGIVLYTILVTNTGPSDATGVVVTDNLPGPGSATPSQGSCTGTTTVTCNLGNISNGNNATINIFVALPPGVFSNTASVVGNETDPNQNNNSDTEETTVDPADLSISKSDFPYDPLHLGEPLTYTLSIINNGDADATGVVVTDTLPTTVVFSSATPSQGSCSGTTTVVCNLNNLDEDETATITIVVTPTQAGTITNTARVAAVQPDPIRNNNAVTETTTVEAADLSISKSAAPNPVTAGESLTYTLTIYNIGPSAATGIVVTDILPAGVTFNPSGSTATCTDNSGTVSCTLSNLPSDDNTTVIIKVDVDSAQTASLSNQASVSSILPDPNTSNNTSNNVNTTVNTKADLSISKDDSLDPITVGHPLTYTLTIVNNGPSDATGVVATDTLPDNVSFISASAACSPPVGREITCNLGSLAKGAVKTVNIAISSTITGSITNLAEVESAVTDPVAGNDTADEETTIADKEINKVFLPVVLKAPPTELYIDNDTGGVVTFTVLGVGVSCQVPTGDQHYYCGSFPAGIYDVRVVSICGPTETIPDILFSSGEVTKRVFCK